MAKTETETITDPKEEQRQISEANEQAKTAILQFLDALDISKIVYVDDRCSIQELKEAFIGKLKALYKTKPKDLDFVDWDSPDSVFDSGINAIWDEADEAKRRELFLSILQFENNQEELENSVAPLKLKEYLNDRIVLLSPTDWVNGKDEIIEELRLDSKVLFLFDIDFRHAPPADGRDGRDMAAELLGNETIQEFVYCGIFSHLFQVDQESEKREEYCETHGLSREKFYTISKKRFQDDSYLPGLAEGIRNSLLVNEVEQLKKESERILKKSFTSAFLEIQDLDPESFNHIIVHSSYQEGIWEMLSLIRLKSIISQNTAFKELLDKKKRTRINGYLKGIREIKDIETGGSTPFEKTQIQTLREKELYIHGDIINQLHFPISNGDIFKIKGKEYILIGQPCNLALRKTGGRDIMSGKVYDSAFLLEIKTIGKDKFEKFRPGQLASIGVIESANLDSERIKFVRFQLYKTVSLSPLDLTLYNTDGTATINLNKLENDSTTIQESWKLRYKNIHEEFSNYRDNIRAYKRLRSASKSNLKNLVFYGEIFKGYNIKNDEVLNRSGNRLTFDLKRISHYKEPYSTDLLQQFMQFLSRNAFDRDFLKD